MEAKKKASVFLRTVNAQYSFLLLLGGAADQAGARGVAVPLFFLTINTLHKTPFSKRLDVTVE